MNWNKTIQYIIDSVENYFDICGFSFIHLIKELDFLKTERKLENYKIIELEDSKYQVEIYLIKSLSRLIEEPCFEKNIYEIKFLFWR